MCREFGPSTRTASGTKPCPSITEVLTPASPLWLSILGSSEGMNCSTLLHIAFFESELFHSFHTSERNFRLRRKSRTLGVIGPSTIFPKSCDLFSDNPRYAPGPATRTAFGPISLLPLARIIKRGSRKGNSLYLATE